MNLKLKNTLYSYLILIASFCYQNLNAQTCIDLVTNGSFETFSSAGSNKVATGWVNMMPAFTPDLFNASANGIGYGTLQHYWIPKCT